MIWSQKFNDSVLVISFASDLPDAFLIIVAGVETVFYLTGSKVDAIFDLRYFDFLLKTIRMLILKDTNYIRRRRRQVTENEDFISQFCHSISSFTSSYADSVSEIDVKRKYF